MANYEGVSLSRQDLLSRTTFEIDKGTLRRLVEVKEHLGLATNTSTVRALILVARGEGLIPYAVPKIVFKDSRPVVITGEPGSGKTTLVKQLLMDRDYPAIIIDVNNEFRDSELPNGGRFQGFKRIDVGDIFRIDYSKPGRYRVVPDPNVEVSKAQVELILSNFNMIKLNGFNPDVIPSGILSKWVIVIEESHRFLESPQFKSFLVEARKVTRKVISICTDWQVLDGMGRIMKPPSWEELTQETGFNDLED